MPFVPAHLEKKKASSKKVAEEKKEEYKYIPTINRPVSSLPSRSLAYPENAVIKYRPYVFGEIKAISQSTLSSKDSFDKILEGIDCNFDKMDLTLHDVIYLGLLRRMDTFGEDNVQIQFNCHKCTVENKQKLDMNLLEFEDIQAEALPVKAKLGNKTLSFWPLTMKMMYSVLDENKENADEGEFIKKMVINKKEEETEKIIYGIDYKGTQILKRVDELLHHGLKRFEIVCDQDECKHPNELSLDGGEGLLMPFRTGSESVDDNISFG